MVLVDQTLKPKGCREFEAEVLVLYHSTTISTNYQAVVHCGVAQQTCKIVGLDKEYIRTGDKAKTRFRFMYWPEYVKEGNRLIFREGRTKGIGRITRVIPTEEEIGDNFKSRRLKKGEKRSDEENEEKSEKVDVEEKKEVAPPTKKTTESSKDASKKTISTGPHKTRQ
jgi:selenocysteine-specific translation elongation factor